MEINMPFWCKTACSSVWRYRRCLSVWRHRRCASSYRYQCRFTLKKNPALKKSLTEERRLLKKNRKKGWLRQISVRKEAKSKKSKQKELLMRKRSTKDSYLDVKWVTHSPKECSWNDSQMELMQGMSHRWNWWKNDSQMEWRKRMTKRLNGCKEWLTDGIYARNDSQMEQMKRMTHRLNGWKEWLTDGMDEKNDSQMEQIKRMTHRLNGFKEWLAVIP